MTSRRSLKDAIQADSELSNFVFGERVVQKIETEGLEQRAILSAIHRTTLQKRRYFDQAKIEEWASTEIKANGIRSPLWVRPLPGGGSGEYELIAGERRYRAAEFLGLPDVPIRVFPLDDKQALMASLVENMQRQDLSPLEETEGTLEALAMELDYSVEQVISLLYQMNNASKGMVNQNVLVSPEGQKVEMVFKFLGRLSWKSFVSSRLPLLKKPPEILDALREGKIEYTKAMEIAKVKNEQYQQTLLEHAISEGLSLSEIKQRVKTLQQPLRLETESLPLKQKIEDVLQRFRKAKVWDDPKKQRQVEKLLAQIESLMEK
ncbi:MAG: ParB/RepB/Spo0J family partition protein [Drouetiella hepatica Uher 2000/2452]|jgi:ParB family chromosome partitioning protein|uniref:ParB/RepB/Spo0J family partition protein n=1 Tax=Drouetiella hepatica Uher 2000/2452 TaxID=904376 RepID=A0A951QHY1_9CYAN|nr:ParB/RepB/Spo0J family partition protein [Drouetiella hepatica Uher 2000/2452]